MRRRVLCAAAITVTTVAASAAAMAPAGAAPTAKAVPNSRPAWVASAKSLGHAAAAGKVSARVYLAPKGGLAALKAEALAVSTPGSAQYHKFLTSAEYTKQFGVTNAVAASVASYLRSTGLEVTGTGADNRYLTVTGTVAKADKAFGTTIDRYNHAGHTVQAPAKVVNVPSSIAASVLAVTGLDTTPHVAQPASKQQDPPPAGFRNARPCSAYYGQLSAKYAADYKTKLPKFQGQTLSYAPCGYTGPQFRAAYEGANPAGLDGTGVSVGIVDAYASPTIASDTNTYASQHGDGSYAKGQLKQTNASTFTNQSTCVPSGWYGEETLDVEAVHAMAPGATVHYYGAASCLDSDLLDALARTVKQDQVQIVSNSYGEAADGENSDSINAYEAVFLQGATEGISFTFSSGDSGDELATTGLKQADYPTSDPYVTSVGGTSTGIGADGTVSFQTGWGTDKYSLSTDGKSWTPVGYLYGAGGGTSTLFNAPSYQAGINNSPYRTNPDVAMDADPNTGMLIGETQTFANGTYYDEYRIGGTSLASPLFAGMTALAIQHDGGTGGGLLNPTIYKDSTSAFTDVLGNPKTAGDVRVDFKNGVDATGGLSYSVRTFDDDSSLATTKGYDLVTGVGTPNTSWLSALG